MSQRLIADGSAFKLRTEGFCAVYNHRNPDPVCHRKDFIVIQRDPVHLYRDQCAGLVRQSRFQDLRGDVVSRRIALAQHRNSALIEDHIRRRDEGQIWNQYLVPWTYAEGSERDVKRCCSGRNCDCVSGTREFYDGLLERLDFRSGADSSAAYHLR